MAVCSRCYADAGLRVDLELPPALPLLPAAVEVALYRIAQEALTNVMKHARARSCALALAIGPHGVQLRIADDGVGPGDSPTWGVGMHSMRERAEEIGGSCRVERRPGGGTVVIAELPRGASQ